MGTGGASRYGIGTIKANSEVRNIDAYGVLKMTLHPTSYDWEFIPEAGKTFTDSGTTACHGTPPPPPPQVPQVRSTSSNAGNTLASITIASLPAPCRATASWRPSRTRVATTAI